MAVKLIIHDVRSSAQTHLNESKKSRKTFKLVLARRRRLESQSDDVSQQSSQPRRKKEGSLTYWDDVSEHTIKQYLSESEAEIAAFEALLTHTKLWDESESRPVHLQRAEFSADVWPSLFGHSSKVWFFKNSTYEVSGKYNDSEQSLLVQEFEDRARRKFERLTHKFSLAESTDPKALRPRIPEEVRIAVWRRDGGCCARCGSRERLEYDHIIALTRGGSNTTRNIELLCEACNRSKGSEIQ